MNRIANTMTGRGDDSYVEFLMPKAACIAVADGEGVMVFTDRYSGAIEGSHLAPIQRAVICARLRALADELERVEATP